jgi:hypothetical protein
MMMSRKANKAHALDAGLRVGVSIEHLWPAPVMRNVSRESMSMVTDTIKTGLVVGAICLTASSPAWAFTLMAPLGGPPWPAEHDWTVHGCGLRGYRGGYTHMVAGSHDYMLHVPFFAAASVVLIIGAGSALGMMAIRAFKHETTCD